MFNNTISVIFGLSILKSPSASHKSKSNGKGKEEFGLSLKAGLQLVSTEFESYYFSDANFHAMC